MEIAIIIILILIISAMGYVMRNMYRLINTYEDMIDYDQSVFTEILELATKSQIRLKELDIQGAFKADDQVGLIFSNIDEVATTLNQKIIDAHERKTEK